MNHHLLFIRSPIAGYPGFFQVLAIMNKAAAVIHIPTDPAQFQGYFFFHSLNSAPLSHSTRPSRNRGRGKKPAEAILWHKAEGVW